MNSSSPAGSAQATSLRVCFVALNAYPVIDAHARGVFGGIETRSWLFARALAARPDVRVDFVVRHWRPLNRESYHSVQLHLWRDRLYPLRDSVRSRVRIARTFPWLQVKHPSLNLIWQLPLLALAKMIRGRTPDPRTPHPLLSAIDTDLFLTFGVQTNSATVIASARARGVPAVLFLGSDGDLDERYAREENFVSVYRDRADICHWVLQQADVIIAQTERQQRMLRDRFGRESEIVANPIDVADWDRHASDPLENPSIASLDRYALWIGRAEGEHKRPQLCLELAQRCPEVSFLMLLNPRDDVVEQQVRRSAPPNVTIVESVPFSQMPAVFRKAALLVNTSSLEGFPNTFLQAALAQVPVASLAVEEEFLQSTGLGEGCGGDLDKLVALTRAVWCGDRRFDTAAARQHVAAEHGLDRQAARLEGVLRRVVMQTRRD